MTDNLPFTTHLATYTISEELVVKFQKEVEDFVHSEIKNLCQGYRVELTLDTTKTLNAVINAMPQKVAFHERMDGERSFYCPVCHRNITMLYSPYCSHCGKKLDWEGSLLN